jgi:Ca2+-binding EF-hand superfamily protein
MSGISGLGGGFMPSAIKQFAQNLFSQIDLSGDGSVSKTELEQAVTKGGGNTTAADALYSVLDPTNSGGFGEQQLAQVLPGSGFSDQMQAQMIGYQAQGWPGASGAGASGPQPAGQLAQSLFSQIDANGDGSISQSELEQAVTKAGGTKEGADALYAKLDPNGTGSVNEQQFSQSLSQAAPQSHHHHHHHGGGGQTASATGTGSAADALTSLFNADGGGAGNSPTQIAQNMFTQSDLNGDGALTQSELEQSVTAAGGSTSGAQRHRQREPATIHQRPAAAVGLRQYRAGRPPGAARPGLAEQCGAAGGWRNRHRRSRQQRPGRGLGPAAELRPDRRLLRRHR